MEGDSINNPYIYTDKVIPGSVRQVLNLTY